MAEENLSKSSDTSIEREGLISKNLSKEGIPNQSLADDHIGIEIFLWNLANYMKQYWL